MGLPSGPNFEFHADRPVVMNIDLNELFSVRNRSVVITGGASGIGFAVASTLTDRGANVTLPEAQGCLHVADANADVPDRVIDKIPPIVMLARYGSVSPHRCHPIARHHHACSNNSRTSVSDLIGLGLEASNGS